MLSLSILTFMSKQTAGCWEIPSVCRQAGWGRERKQYQPVGGESHTNNIQMHQSGWISFNMLSSSRRNVSLLWGEWELFQGPEAGILQRREYIRLLKSANGKTGISEKHDHELLGEEAWKVEKAEKQLDRHTHTGTLHIQTLGGKILVYG